MSLIWKLLRENISKIQLFGFFIANLVGLSIVLIGCQFYFDVNPIFSQKDNLFKRDYFTVTKRVNLLNAFSSGSTGFSKSEIDELNQSGFVKDAGSFMPSQFNVYAGINQGGIQFSTEMFFESVPDRFIDVKTDEWHFSPDENNIPIILPKNYLDLYNFGFAESRSTPKLSENMIGMVNLDVVIWGRGQKKEMKGRIVGFSSRINTILVPESFMIWANQNFGNSQNANPSRLILEIPNIADPAISEYFTNKGYDVEGDNTAVSRMSSLLKILVTVVIAIGSIICILSFIILALSIYLLLEKNMDKLKKLRLIGYARRTVTRPYELLILSVNIVIWAMSVITVIVVRNVYFSVLKKIWVDLEPVSIFNTVVIGIVIFLFLSVLNIFIIRRKVK